MHIGKKIKLVLTQKDMKNKSFAEKVGDHRRLTEPEIKNPSGQAVGSWIKTGSIAKIWLPSIANVLGVTIEWLVNGNDEAVESSAPSKSSMSISVAKKAAAQAFATSKVVPNMYEEQFVKMFLLFCKVDETLEKPINQRYYVAAAQDLILPFT